MAERTSPIPLLRFAAFILDGLTFSLLLIIPASVISYSVVWLAEATKWINIVWYTALLILLLAMLFRDGWGGRSLGKRVLGLRVVTRDGAPCGWVRSFVRNIPLMIPLWNLLEIYLVSRGKPRTGDRLARTVVAEE